MSEETYLSMQRRQIEAAYEAMGGTGCGSSFGELLCYEMHVRGRTFVQLARAWSISLADLGDLIADHCRRMSEPPKLNFLEPAPADLGPRLTAARAEAISIRLDSRAASLLKEDGSE